MTFSRHITQVTSTPTTTTTQKMKSLDLSATLLLQGDTIWNRCYFPMYCTSQRTSRLFVKHKLNECKALTRCPTFTSLNAKGENKRRGFYYSTSATRETARQRDAVTTRRSRRLGFTVDWNGTFFTFQFKGYDEKSSERCPPGHPTRVLVTSVSSPWTCCGGLRRCRNQYPGRARSDWGWAAGGGGGGTTHSRGCGLTQNGRLPESEDTWT